MNYQNNSTSNVVVPSKLLYCGQCGMLLQEDLVPAEKYEACYESGCLTPYTHSPYDRKTGKRQWCRKYTCPLKVKFFNSSHTDFIEEEIITFEDGA